MKSLLTLVVVLIAAGGTFATESSIELRGVITVGGGATRLSLTDKSNGTTRWVDVGQIFAGFTVASYDAAQEIAVLVKDGKELKLRLNASRIADASVSAAKLTWVEAMAIFNNLRQIAAAADQYYLENGRSTATLNDLVGETKYIRQLRPIAGEDYGSLKLVQGNEREGNERFTVTTAAGEAVTYDAGRPEISSFYTVKPGDTLEMIAQATDTSVQRLVYLNDLADPAKLNVGKSLRTK